MATPRALESPDLYNIGWITALPIERAASTAMLDERHDKPRGFVQHPSDTNAYTWGRIGEHYLVIASLPAGQIGTTPAATTASNLLASLPQIRVALLVGIGGGIARPEEGRDIRLGDIVVSQPQGTTGGVVQYDLGKAKLNKEWERRGFLSAPPPVLLHALAAIQAEYELGESRIAEFLDGTPKLKKGVSGYSHQGFENDRLFKASFDHTGAANCANCKDEEVIERIQRDTTDPEVHYGIIASGNTVVKNALIRDEIVQEVGEECMCFEMEAAGLMNHFPCLVIRGICDYADSHKNDRWQRYASATAAAYAKDLLGYVPIRGLQETPRALDILRSVRQNIQEIHTIASETKSGIKSLQSDSHHAKLKTWLLPPDVSTNLTDALKCRQQGTCSWLLESERYREWKSGKRQHLWLHGIPGCGKTVLSAAIVDDLMQQLQPPDVVLFFYFDFKEIEKQSPNKMVRSLVAQLYSSCVDSRAELEKLFCFCEKGDRQPTETALLSTFLEMSKHAGRLQIVLDALDECSMRGDLLKWLETLSLSDHEGLHLLATSRKEEEIESGLGHWLDCTSIILIQSHSINQDIRTYLHETLRSDRGFDRWHRRPEVLNEIEAELMLKADGMFRWVVCQIDSLKHCLDLRKLRQSLRTLPATLQETYARILIQIPENYRKEAIRILQFLTYSDRPLTVYEVVDIIVVEPDEDPHFDPTFRMPEAREIMRICSSLVSLVTRQKGESIIEELQLAHFTVQQYLESDGVDGALSLMTITVDSPCRLGGSESFQGCMRRATAKGDMTRVCLAYLSQVDEGKSLTTIKEELPLAKYSAESWTGHARHSETRPDVEKSILNFFLHQSQAYTVWVKLFDLDQPWDGPLWWADKRTAPPLYYASLAGLQHTVLALLNNGAEANADGGAYGNALQAASSVGETHVVRLLLDHGADVNVQGGLYGNPLQAASIRGHKDIVLLLLTRGAEIYSQGGLYSDALYASAAEGHEEIVRLLIDHGANVNARGRINVNTVTKAPFADNKDLVQQLIAQGIKASRPQTSTVRSRSFKHWGKMIEVFVDENGKALVMNSIYGNAIHAASIQSRLQMISLFDRLRHPTTYSDITFNSLDGSTPVAIASFGGHVGVVQLLVERGADTNIAANDGTTPLLLATPESKFEIIEILVKQNAQVGVGPNMDCSPMHLAAGLGRTDVVKLFIQSGADPDQKMRGGQTPLHLACSKGQLDSAKLLIANGANFDSADEIGCTPLHLATQDGCVDIIKLLIANGANCDPAATNGITPLYIAVHQGFVDIVKLLIENGANCDPADTNGATPLRLATQKGFFDIVRLLIENGANCDPSDTNEATPLHVAIQEGFLDIVRLLIENGANCDSAMKGGHTPLDIAIHKGFLDAVRILTKNGAGCNTASCNGRAPLHCASRNGYLEIVRVLIENGADCNNASNQGGRPLDYASWSGHSEIVRLLIENGADCNSMNCDGWSPLYFACQNGHLETVRLLIDSGAVCRSMVDIAPPPLHLASQNSHLEVASFLLTRGAQINARDKDGYTALYVASARGDINMVHLFVDRGADLNIASSNGRSPLYIAFEAGYTQTAELLIQSAADIELKDNNGWSPLTLTSFKGDLEGVRLLLTQGAYINVRSDHGDTPLFAASSSGHIDVVRLLLARGADINTTGSNGCSPLYIAFEFGHTQIGQLLLQSSADFELKNNDGWTPLTLVSFKGNIEGVQLLLDQGAEINVRSNDGRTPLYVASSMGHVDVVLLLLERGADVTLANDRGHNPATIASSKGHDSVVQLLRLCGADA